MSTSSCQNDIEIRSKREEEIYTRSKDFLRQVATNLCIPEGMSGKFDLAFKVDRQKQIARAMKDIAQELEK